MATLVKEKEIEACLTDAVGQWERRVALPLEAPIGAVLESLLPQLELPLNQAYGVVNDRSQQYLRESDLVREVVEPDDRLRLLPHVTAGR